jgi:hypothetical protein
MENQATKQLPTEETKEKPEKKEVSNSGKIEQSKSEPKNLRKHRFIDAHLLKTCSTINPFPSFGTLPTINMNSWNHLIDRTCNFTNAIWAKNLRNSASFKALEGSDNKQAFAIIL